MVAVDEPASQFELSRPAGVVLVGWMINGTVTIGNHSDAEVVIPENRMKHGQHFAAADYFSLKVRGKRVHAGRLHDQDAQLYSAGEVVDETRSSRDLRLVVVRRDSDGEEDFEVPLALSLNDGLPDPRARQLSIGLEDRVVLALFTRGLPLGTGRPMDLGPIEATFTYDGDNIQVTHYLESYRSGDGSPMPFFVSQGGQPFQTMPEDGRAMTLQPGDRLVAGIAIFEVRG